MRQLSKALTSK